jgi:hypothetical protein
MLLTLRVDSVVGSAVMGQLDGYFAGDMGMDTRDFPRFEGELDNDTAVRFTIYPPDRDQPSFVLAGKPSPDTIALTTFVLGPDTLSGPDQQWWLIRRE